MYVCARDIDFDSFYGFFSLNFVNVPTVRCCIFMNYFIDSFCLHNITNYLKNV